MANLNLKFTKDFKFNVLVVFGKDKDGEWKYRTSIYRGNISDSIDENSTYHLVLIGQMSFGKNYSNITLINQNAIKYELV